MKEQRADLLALLNGSAALTERVGGRFYSGLAGLTTQVPFVTVSIVDMERPRTHDQRNERTRRKADRIRFRVSAYAFTAEEAADIADMIDNEIDGKASDNSFVYLTDGAADGATYLEDASKRMLHNFDVEFICFRRAID